MKPRPRPDPRKEGDPPFRLKTIHRNRHTKKLCKETDLDAEAIVVAVKKVRLIEGDLYRIDEGTHVVEGRVFQIDDEGQAVPAVPIHQRAPSPATLFEFDGSVESITISRDLPDD